jgi:hypothetical protein
LAIGKFNLIPAYGQLKLTKAALARIARLLMNGNVYVR